MNKTKNYGDMADFDNLPILMKTKVKTDSVHHISQCYCISAWDLIEL